MNTADSTTIREIVSHDFRTAAVFEKYSLDFCCKGGKTVAAACGERNIDPAPLLAELRAVTAAGPSDEPRFAEWEADDLTVYIVDRHHAYVRTALPSILAHARKVASVHGERHPEMKEVADIMGVVANDMQHHMLKEERILFPYIEALAGAVRAGASFAASPFGTVRNPIAMMEQEHESAGSLMEEVRRLTAGYTLPEDGCTTYRVTLQELEEFERDLHRHVHLENNILFPKGIALEERRAAAGRVA